MIVSVQWIGKDVKGSDQGLICGSLSWHLLGRTEKKYKIPQSRQLVFSSAALLFINGQEEFVIVL
jgi:hypothetical protein